MKEAGGPPQGFSLVLRSSDAQWRLPASLICESRSQSRFFQETTITADNTDEDGSTEAFDRTHKNNKNNDSDMNDDNTDKKNGKRMILSLVLGIVLFPVVIISLCYLCHWACAEKATKVAPFDAREAPSSNDVIMPQKKNKMRATNRESMERIIV